MMDPLYGPLIKQMNLTPEEAETFKELLADNLMKGAEKASELFRGLSATNRTEMLHTLAPDQLESFARFQTNQLQMLRMSMSMARRFLAPDQPAGGSVPPPQ